MKVDSCSENIKFIFGPLNSISAIDAVPLKVKLESIRLLRPLS